MSSDFQRSLGLELSGPRSNKSVLSVLDCYTNEQRWVLSDLYVFREMNDSNPDHNLIDYINDKAHEHEKTTCTGIAINAPLSLPPYLKSSERPLPKPEDSTDIEVQWMTSKQKKLAEKAPGTKPFIPYLQRPAEIYLRTQTPERFPISDTFSTNGAALAARMQYIGPYLETKQNEVYVKGSVTRICQSLKMPKFVENGHSNITSGLESRHEFFIQLQKHLPRLFIYDEHIEAMTLHLYMFHSFVSALTQQLINKKAVEQQPTHYPQTATWINIPKTIIDWDSLFS